MRLGGVSDRSPRLRLPLARERAARRGPAAAPEPEPVAAVPVVRGEQLRVPRVPRVPQKRQKRAPRGQKRPPLAPPRRRSREKVARRRGLVTVPPPRGAPPRLLFLVPRGRARPAVPEQRRRNADADASRSRRTDRRGGRGHRRVLLFPPDGHRRRKRLGTRRSAALGRRARRMRRGLDARAARSALGLLGELGGARRLERLRERRSLLRLGGAVGVGFRAAERYAVSLRLAERTLRRAHQSSSRAVVLLRRVGRRAHAQVALRADLARTTPALVQARIAQETDGALVERARGTFFAATARRFFFLAVSPRRSDVVSRASVLLDTRVFARRVRLPREKVRLGREVDVARRGLVAAFLGVGVETRLGFFVISHLPTGVTRREFAVLDEPSELLQVHVVRVVEALGARELRVHRVVRRTQPEHLRRVLQRAPHRGRHRGSRGFLGNHETRALNARGAPAPRRCGR